MAKRFFPALAAAFALTLGALQASHGAEAPPKPVVTPALAKTLKAAQDAATAKHWPEVIAKAQEVLASANHKPDDIYVANYFLFQAYTATGNQPEQRKALQGIVDSGFLSVAQSAIYIKALMSMAFQAKDYQAAIDFGLRLTKSDHADPEVFTTIGQGYFLMNNFAESARFFKSLIKTQIERGQKPLEQNVVMMQSAYQKLGDKDGATDALETLVVYYPKPNYWEALLYSVRGITNLQPRQKLFVYRLMWATGTLKLARDYNDFAERATFVGLPAEAEKVFDAGLKAGVFAAEEKIRAERLMGSSAKAAEAEKANLPKRETDAAAAASGDQDVALGMTYYSYGDFDKAVSILQQGIAKGGIKDDLQVEAALMLGMAQLHTKDKAAAQKTFNGIKTSDANWQRIVRFWALYAK